MTYHAHAMRAPAAALWGLSISNADFEKLKAGLQPRDQDDKWFITSTAQSRGTISMAIVRASFNRKLYILIVSARREGGSSDGSSVTIEGIIWEQNSGGFLVSDIQAKKEVVMISRCNLECDFDALPDYYDDAMWNYASRINAIDV